MLCGVAEAQQGTGNREQGTGSTSANAGAAGAGERVALDRVVAVVNEDLILESDLDEEARMAAFQPIRVQEVATREQLIERLIDRDLILQQIRLLPQAAIEDAQVDSELRVLRRNIPECVAYGCETDAGWEKFVAAQGFTVEELRERWRQRMEVLRFIEARFRMGIRISQAEMDAYYKGTLVPAYEKEKVNAPAEAAIADKHSGDIVAAAGGQAAGRLADVAARGGKREDCEAGRGAAMSADEKQPNGGEKLLPVKRRRSIAWHVTRAGVWGFAGGLALVILLVGGITWYTATAYFQRRVGREIVSVLGNATGGRVEVGGVKFSLWHLKIEVDGLVIHGTEGPGEAPYLSAEKIEVRVGISSFFSHATGAGLRSHVGLKLLRVERPQVHLMVDKDGKTNAPVPKHPSTSKEPVADTLLDLRAKEVALVDGVALVNDRAIPFDVAARDLDAEVRYLRATDRYGIALGVNDLRTRAEAQAEARSRLHFDAELGRDAVELKGLEFDTGATSVLHATGTLTHFAEPQWQGAVNGTLELKQVTVLTDVEGFTGGSVDLAVSGHSCAVMAAGTQAKPRFWLRRRAGANAKAGAAAAGGGRSGVQGRATCWWAMRSCIRRDL